MAVDWRTADRQAIERLHRELRPIPYTELARCALRGVDVSDYSEKTKPVEKFRQRVAEHNHPTMVHIPGGDIALADWFPMIHQPRLIPPEPLRIEGRCLVSYNAGYEHAKREPYLKDWYSDGKTTKRHERRVAAYQFEHHVRDYYLSNWPRFCQPPSNDGQWDRPARDDFRIKLPDRSFLVDTKSASYAQDGFNWFMARRIHTDVLYVAGRWDATEEVAIVDGILPGKWMKEIAGYVDGDHFKDGDLMSFEVLSVMLTMADCAMTWADAWCKLRAANGVLV